MSTKNKAENDKAVNGGKMARIGHKFHEEINDIQLERLKKGIDDDKIGTQKITNLITRHDLWINIKKDIIRLSKDEVNSYG